MLGNLYIIRNSINSKVYIGKTYTSLNERLSRHIKDALRKDRENNNKFHNAIRKYGPEHFYIELLGQFEKGILEQKEIEYIAKYDSYHNGYNSTLGGEGTPTLEFDNKDIVDIINRYINKQSLSSIAKEYYVDRSVIKNLLLSNNIELRNNDTKVQIYMYDLIFNNMILFKSKSEAYNYINNNEHICRITDFWNRLKIACQNGNIAYGHRWQLASDLIYEDKIFRTKFDKEAYIEGKPAYQPEGKNYWVVDGALDKVISLRSIYSKYRYKCIKCGNTISNRTGTGLCKSCAQTIAKGKQIKPSKEELQVLLDKGLQKKQIAKMYDRSDSTVHYWINSYGLR